ncbi:hypothetical protein SUGI_0093910 [Cryptomeria japonica]|nr:hypothetical protein SUGI_0093910 [Cryptomeria japonica]
MSLDINGSLGGKRLNSEEICINFTEELEEDVVFWEKHAVIARIIGLNWSRKEIKKWVEGNWGLWTVIKFIPKDFFVVLFEDGEDRDQIINQENWFANNHAIYLQLWSLNFDPLPLVVYSALVWIQLYNLPIEYWTEIILEKIGRTLGTLLEVDFDDEDDLCKFARLRIAAVKRIPLSITILTSSGEWRQQVEIEKENKQCPRCSSKFHRLEACKMFVRKAKNVIRKPTQFWRRKSENSLKTVIDQEGKRSREVGQTHNQEMNPSTSLISASCNSKETRAEEKILVLGDSDECSRLNINAGRENDAVPNTSRITPSCRGLSDTEFEFEKGLDDDFFQEDELENIDPRCISQSANALLGKAKGFRGRKRNRQKREERAREKCIISVLDFMKKAKGEGSSLGKR